MFDKGIADTPDLEEVRYFLLAVFINIVFFEKIIPDGDRQTRLSVLV